MMTKSLAEPTFPRDIAASRFGVKGQRQKPLASNWITPDCLDILNGTGAYGGGFNGGRLSDVDCGLVGGVGEVILQNSWLQPPGTLELFAVRKHMDGSLEFKGHLDASGGAVSGTVAVTLPGAGDCEPDYLPPYDQYFSTVITPDNGATFSIALVFADSTTGDVTITWPAT